MFSSTDLKQKEIKDTLDIDQLDNDFNKLLAHMFDQVRSCFIWWPKHSNLFLPTGYVQAKFNDMTKWATISTNL